MYYPLSQITPNLYTNGGEFVYASNLASYTGYYFKTSKGEYYTGRNQNDLPNVLLIPQSIPTSTSQTTNNPTTPIYLTQDYDENILNYIVLKNPTLNSHIPLYSPVLPTQQDYQNGEFRRYFCKKTNELTYIEINIEVFTKLSTKDPQIEYALYFPFNIAWALTGDKQKVSQTNKNIVELTIKRLKLYKFDEYLKKDYIKYYK